MTGASANAPAPTGLLIRDGVVYSAAADARVYDPGSVLVVGDTIVAVGAAADVDEAVAACEPAVRAALRTVDARSMMVLPGFVNAHWHEMYAMRIPFKGALRSADDRADEPGFMACGGDMARISTMFDSFHDLAGQLAPDEAEAIAAYSLWTQLRSGTTTIADVGSFTLPHSLADAALRIGLRCVLGTWATDGVAVPEQNAFRRTREPEAVLGPLEDVLRRCAQDRSGLLRGRPTAVYPGNMSDELGRGLAELTKRYDTTFATHVGALRHEDRATRACFDTTPLRRLHELGLLDDRLMAVHCAFADEYERSLLIDNRVHISHSPAKYGSTGESALTETRLITELIRAGLDVSVSTDGVVYPLGGMAENMRAAWQAHNELSADQSFLPPTDVLAMATRLPARGLRWDDEIGSLETGKRADLVLVSTDDWRYVLNPRPLEAFLHLGGSIDVDTVIVAGRVLVRAGQAELLDERQLLEDYLDALHSFSARRLGIDEKVLRPLLDDNPRLRRARGAHPTRRLR
ncbi:amidohydrolase [Embleya scabrispora]|uniref:Amidohydrolase n=1 Tax=Embleya scabrispora TaxID=159449 RepID=A0A1T3NS67_9ACTN|nr:amidohydrolase family protein [Embleya scabrispora]OPC79594.1 amidohydrolase [Embleya scabrispora]